VSAGYAEALNKSSSREAILYSAFEVFSAKGVSGARVDEIVDKAGLNVRMIYHHFGSKEGLYDEAIKLLVSERNRECWADDDTCSAERHLERLAAYSLRVPAYSKIIRWERASGCQTLAVTLKADEFLPPRVRHALSERMRDPALIEPLWVMINATGSQCFENPWEARPEAMRRQELVDQYLSMLRIG
jgi:AcrR family transcriptional regulator